MKISSNTSVFGVVGNPVRHSLSPIMHNAAFSEVGYDGVYVAFEVQDLDAAISGMKGLGINGMSVTIPHKVNVMSLLDECDDLSKKIGAVNTIVQQNRRLLGYNTDCMGAVKALREKTDISGRKVLIVGAGGAARAIAWGISEENGRVIITNRTPKKGRTLSEELKADFCSYDNVKKIDWDILINTTSVGMTPHTDSMPVPLEAIRPGRIVMDIVYNPVETMLLKVAKERACIILDGVMMFVYQGAMQFELWTGQKAPLKIMEKVFRNALGNIGE
jgi:shikimate dehydrogenase